MNKENKSKLEALLEKVAYERDLEIYDLNIQTNQNPIVIDLSEFASGTYMIKIQTNTGNYTEVVSKK